MKKAMFLLLAMAVGLGTTTASATIRIRVSVKFVLDGAGQRPGGNLTSDAHVQEQMARGNDILAQAGSGYQLELTEITTISGVSQWFNVDARDSNTRLQLQAAALANPGVYKFRANTINVYINGNGNSGNSAILAPDQIILIGQGGRPTTISHEIGHYLGLFHTQGHFCGGCSEPPAPGAPIIGNLCSSEPDDDSVGDTLPDLECWTQNQIAQRSFGQNYGTLSAGNQKRVDDVFFNLMSYHNDPRTRLTPGQINRITDNLNGPRFNVVSGKTWFVDCGNTCQSPGDLPSPFSELASYVTGWSWGARSSLGVVLSPQNPPPGAPALPCPPVGPCSLSTCFGGPFKTFQDGVNGASSGDRLQIRNGNYGASNLRITKALTLTADGGTVAIGR